MTEGVSLCCHRSFPPQNWCWSLADRGHPAVSQISTRFLRIAAPGFEFRPGRARQRGMPPFRRVTLRGDFHADKGARMLWSRGRVPMIHTAALLAALLIGLTACGTSTAPGAGYDVEWFDGPGAVPSAREGLDDLL